MHSKMSSRKWRPFFSRPQCINWTLRNKLQWNSNQNKKTYHHEKAFEILDGKWRPFCPELTCIYVLKEKKPEQYNLPVSPDEQFLSKFILSVHTTYMIRGVLPYNEDFNAGSMCPGHAYVIASHDIPPLDAPDMDIHLMMTPSNGDIFRVTGPLCGEFTGHRWIPLTKASDAKLWCFLWSTPE